MELKPYQQKVITDLERFLRIRETAVDLSAAYYDFWVNHPHTAVTPFPGKGIEPYKDNIKGVPHLCVKVPTAGGKTFIACNALKPLLNARKPYQYNVVVWLVPGITILEQTVRNLKDPDHPYRQKLNSLFSNRVEVLDKNSLLQGSGFNASSVREQLSILVLTFDSLRAKNKEDRKVFQENSYLQSFKILMDTNEEISLMKVIRHLQPLVVVDESHNAESALSVEMLKDLNPEFILDLTATPRNNSNIISFVDALELKKEHMVKLPVIVYNHHDKNEVVSSAISLQRKLEGEALLEFKAGGKYIRPIVLFQAQPRTGSDNTTFVQLKEKLVQVGIPLDQIKIKTAEINEIKDVDLMSPECPVRYIITVNALKEGWDCPFAYILASLADKSSTIDVQQILGRVLRQPHVMKHQSELMNMSFVLTASARFSETLDNIVSGLNRSGYSKLDYKVVEGAPISEAVTEQGSSEKEEDLQIDVGRINPGSASSNLFVDLISEVAKVEGTRMESQIEESNRIGGITLPSDIQAQVNKSRIKEAYRQKVAELRIPQFFLLTEGGDIFGNEVFLNSRHLLQDFQLSKSDAHLPTVSSSGDIMQFDIDEISTDHPLIIKKPDDKARENFVNYINDLQTREARIRQISNRLMQMLGNMYPISEGETRKWLMKVLEDFSDEGLMILSANELVYADIIKKKIESLEAKQAQAKFRELLAKEKIEVRPSFTLSPEIIPGYLSKKTIAKSLYDQEGVMNSFEESMILDIAALPNVQFWTKNIERKPYSFFINGNINHYPDFIILTEKGKLVLLETKGDDRDNSDTAAKIALGKTWEELAGRSNFRYFMVFKDQEMEGAYTQERFLDVMKSL